MAEFLSILDVFVMSSRFEAMPSSLLEAMSMELPVVVNDISAFVNIINDRIDGILYKEGDKIGLAETLIELKEDDDGFKEKLGENARNKILEKYSLQTRVNKTLQIYDDFFEKSL